MAREGAPAGARRYGAGAPAFRSRSLSEAIHSSASASVVNPSIFWRAPFALQTSTMKVGPSVSGTIV
jgi:hypothetical protein